MKEKCVAFALVLLSLTDVMVAGNAVDLSGKWRFAIDQSTNGVAGEWFKKDLAETIKLPGTIDDAGLGPTNTAKATLSGPRRVRDYAGPAWYQRDIDVPAKWQGKRVTLLLERCRWVTTIWLDDKKIGSQDSLISPHFYDLGTAVAPGKHRLTICVDNTVKIKLGVFVSALFGGTPGNMNGITGRIELGATPPVWLDDVQVYPNVGKKTALVKVRIGNSTGKAGSGVLSVGVKSAEVTWDSNGGQAEIEVPVDAKPWDEFTPNLTEVTAKLGEDERTVRFGMRKFEAKGTQFYMNGRPVFLRGTLECQVFPVTGYPPMDVPAWQRIFRIIKTYGLNHMRFHSWCPPEAAFAAADIEGIMLQAEGPMANVPVGKDQARDAFIEAEFRRIVDTYGNHPSFCTMTLGNEYGGKEELLTGWVDMLIKCDSRHLYSSASCAQKTANRQWTEDAKGRGIHGAGTRHDLRDVVASDARPITGHEIGQWMFFPNFDEMKKYTGVMKPDNFDIIRNGLKARGLLDQYPEIYQAVGRQAILLYKEEIEVLLRTQGYAGFSLLDLHDYPTQGTALIGPLDPFWDSKGFITPEKHREYCGPVVPLLRIPKRTYKTDEVFSGAVDLANYGQQDLKELQPKWSIRDEKGREVAGGALAVTSAPTGKLTPLGLIETSLAKANAPCKLTVTVSLKGKKTANEWEIWVYPAAVSVNPPADVLVCRKWSEAEKALADGKKVFFFPEAMNPKLSMRGQFIPVFWSPVWFPNQKPNTMSILCDPKHPALAGFPTESYSNWQWYELLNNSRFIILNDAPSSLRPIVQVIDNFARNDRMGCVFEGRAGKGRLLVCAIDLNGMADENPEARQLLKSLYDYAGSGRFEPTVELPADLLEKLFSIEEAVILTPPPAATPRINGPKIYGARPGHPYLYRIPCTGERPMKFSAQPLPTGLALDSSTGIIRGTTPEKGEYVITLTAENSRGKCERVFKLVAGDTLSLTPQMGFNDWYAYYNRVTEADMREAADLMVSSGMVDAGYQYVNIDDCWMGKRDSDGMIQGNEKFPDMRGLADYIHTKGLKAGLYTSPGPKTCAGYTGSFEHEAQDAKQFASWGFDFLKYDWCSYKAEKRDLAGFMKPYELMGDLLKKQDRDIVLNLCQYGMGEVWKWGQKVGGHSWRTGGDLGFELDRVLDIALENAKLGAFNGPGGWNDPDYIQIGWIGSAKGMGQSKPCPLTPTEQYSFMSLWCLLPAPLFFSGDMKHLDPFTVNILCNAEVIDVNQDSLGKSANVVMLNTNSFLMIKDLEDGAKAVGLCNRGEIESEVTAKWSDLGIKGRQSVRDLWRQKDLGTFEDKFSAKVPRHGVVLVKVQGVK